MLHFEEIDKYRENNRIEAKRRREAFPAACGRPIPLLPIPSAV